jgi:hypothetical protein
VKGSGASRRVSRGFHRVGLLLAALAFLIVAMHPLFAFPNVPMLHNLGLGALNGAIVGLLVYGIFRAIGWVISGFMAS